MSNKVLLYETQVRKSSYPKIRSLVFYYGQQAKLGMNSKASGEHQTRPEGSNSDTRLSSAFCVPLCKSQSLTYRRNTARRQFSYSDGAALGSRGIYKEADIIGRNEKMGGLSIRLADRALGISGSPTMAIDAKAKKMTKEGIHVISFGVGEPDFDTPESIKMAAISALQKGFTKYTPVAGIDELKQAIADKLKNDNGLEYQSNQIVVSNGAKHSLYNVMQVLINPGDEVILPAPYWVSYEEMIKLAGGVPRVILTREENDFKLTSTELEGAINPRTRLLILNSPSNPTGSVYTRQELEALGQVVLKHQLSVISDEIYEKLLYDGLEHVSLAAMSPELKELTIVINGVSKSYSMTGWRIGYLAAPTLVAKAVSDLQSHSASNPNSFAQWGAVEALRGSQEPVQQMVAQFAQRRDYILNRLKEMAGITCRRPGGAFYVFPNVSAAFGKRYQEEFIQDAADLARILLIYGRIAVVPGLAFGVKDYLRISYANSLQNIEEGLNRFEQVWSELR